MRCFKTNSKTRLANFLSKLEGITCPVCGNEKSFQLIEDDNGELYVNRLYLARLEDPVVKDGKVIFGGGMNVLLGYACCRYCAYVYSFNLTMAFDDPQHPLPARANA